MNINYISIMYYIIQLYIHVPGIVFNISLTIELNVERKKWFNLISIMSTIHGEFSWHEYYVNTV